MLRQRNSGSVSDADLAYRRDAHEDEDTVSLLEVPTLQQAFHAPPPPSSAFAYFCLFFSLTAIGFLSSLAVLLDNNSMYVKINVHADGTRRDLAKGVRYAAFLYAVCALFSVALVCLQRVTQWQAPAGTGRMVDYDDGMEGGPVDKG